MDSPQNSLRGTGVIVLHELVSNAMFGVALAVIALEKEAPTVSVGVGLDDDDPVEGRAADRQAQCRRSWSSLRNSLNGTRTCVISSRDRIVAEWSVAVSKSMVTAYGVPISSWRR
jgi:hypothetical protein